MTRPEIINSLYNEWLKRVLSAVQKCGLKHPLSANFSSCENDRYLATNFATKHNSSSITF